MLSAEDAARHVVDDVLAGERYIVTHGDLTSTVTGQQELIRRAVAQARDRD